MRRVSSHLHEDDVFLEELETEGERQLRGLLMQQLDTNVSVDKCVAKRRCFAPATVYKPFGEQAAGTLSLTEFQAIQEGDKEVTALRDLGLNDQEIQLWQSRGATGKGSRYGADPEAVKERLQAIEEKILAHQHILAMPQRFSGSKQLNRREMEIENAMFQGNDRHSFLRALYYQDEKCQSGIHHVPISHCNSSVDHKGGESSMMTCASDKEVQPKDSTDHGLGTSCLCRNSSKHFQEKDTTDDANIMQTPQQDTRPGLDSTGNFFVDKAIRSLPVCGKVTQAKITEQVDSVPVEDILKNRLSLDDIRKMPRFANYQPGEPNKVLYLKNLNPKATLKDLFSLFVRFQHEEGPPLLFRLLTGRMKGQAFITFPDKKTAEEALHLVNGFNLLGKPIIIEFGKGETEHKVN
ncbi:RNA-binding protein 41 isoform X2 [Protopterus annectens]|uniref:RNA-binding protein 41 isoform X2 n=1 Tax=Protopterus annectens TaxID=7888 RepID=UPI001CFBBE0A|nr:RNA-binding protein 41 isoform X2 [Protopterus annectens]